jgi:uncharacterized membrane protein YagU involved in acid resistance
VLVKMIQLLKLLLLLAHVIHSLIVSFVAVLLAAVFNQSIDLALNHFGHAYKVFARIDNLGTSQSDTSLSVKDSLPPTRKAPVLI